MYRSEFLRSTVWFARRDRWFTEQAAIGGGEYRCAACGRAASKRQLELHHLDYSGVVMEEGQWRALEAHDDLVPMHPYCHDLLHRLIDRDEVLSHHRTRRDATRHALTKLQRTLRTPEEATP